MQPPAPSFLPGLTPLRGLAALWVVLYHYTRDFPGLHPERYSQLIGGGYLAVDLFFLLSGFIMTHVYWDSFARALPWNGYVAFLKARVARLYPLHVAILLLFLATVLAANATQLAVHGKLEPIPLAGARSVAAFLANVLMLQGLHASALSWNYPAWSISVEFMAYLLLPVLLVLLFRVPAAGRAALACLPVAALGWLAYLTRGDFNQWDGPLALLRCGPEFILGVLLYRIYRMPAARRMLGSNAAFAVACVGVLLGLHFGTADVAIVALFPLLLLVSVSNNGIAGRVLNAPVLVWLGEMSYALYLFHDLVKYAVTRALGDAMGKNPVDLSSGQALALCAAMVTVSLLLAALAHKLIEVPGRRYLRQFFAGASVPDAHGGALPGAARAIREPHTVAADRPAAERRDHRPTGLSEMRSWNTLARGPTPAGADRIDDSNRDRDCRVHRPRRIDRARKPPRARSLRRAAARALRFAATGRVAVPRS